MPDEAAPAAAEEKLMRTLTNEPSEPIQVEDVFIVFQRPRFQEKYRGRIWAAKRLRDYGLDDDEDDPEFAFFIRYWGTLNTFVKHIYVPDDKGDIKLKVKVGDEEVKQTFSDYAYDPKTDLDYGSKFEKFVIDEIYDQGEREDVFVAKVIAAHMEWVADQTVEEEEVKNS